MSPEFVPALELNAGFYRDVVAPLIGDRRHAAALLGYGSELLGFDTERSTDHGWGPRLQVFVPAAEVTLVLAAIDGGLPAEYRGWPVAFGWDAVPATHHVQVVPLDAWLLAQLGCDPLGRMSFADWLTIPQQRLLGVVRGAVYHDPTGALTAVRERLRYFPPDLALWMLACQWRRIWQVEPLVGRTAEVGDEAGSRLVASRIVRDLMRLHFVLARVYWPYEKWFGSAYRALPHAREVLPALEAALDARNHPAREDALVAAYESLARLHNETGLTDPVDPRVSFFYGRPFRVPKGDRFVDACLRRVRDDSLRSRPLVGSIDQIVDSIDVLENVQLTQAMRALYDFPS
ncbi:MAG: hypothetical protein JWM72_645 [Actinomycetia bacterium]|nr:hypothetical protein [Actinomycetes bacterium]